MKKTFAIGDIHGALRALHQLLERINPQDDKTFKLCQRLEHRHWRSFYG